MDFTYIRPATCGVLLLFGATIAIAQEPANLGELLDKGAKRLDASELKALLAGAQVSGGILRSGSRLSFDNTFMIDGKINGRFYGLPVDAAPGMNGTWIIDERGQLCTQTVSIAFGASKGCSFYYTLNNVYYAAQSEDRGAIARMRKVVR